MTTRCPSCSQTGGERSNPQAEARGGEPASRNASELDSASLRKMGVTILPKMVKSATDDEATPVCSRRAPRGGWRQRAGKERFRNLRDPAWAMAPHRESDGLVGGRKGLTGLERRGPTVNVRRSKRPAAAWPQGPPRTNGQQPLGPQ